jgi:hypothetical protein
MIWQKICSELGAFVPVVVSELEHQDLDAPVVGTVACVLHFDHVEVAST